MMQKIKNWYAGKVVSGSDKGFSWIYIEHHRTARVARRLVKFYFDHWKWIIGTLLAIFALFLQYSSSN